MAKLLIILMIGILGGVLVTSLFNIQITPKSAMQPVVVQPTESTIDDRVAAPTTISPTAPTTTKAVTKGSIDIALGYPAGGIPPLKVCLFTVPAKAGEYGKSFYCETSATNQTEMTMAVNPGTYHIFAWPADGQYKLVGSWTPAVACGLSVDCKDHSPLVVTVKSDQTTSGVAIKDWYGDGVGYPTQP
jgi:hypothetical protein